MNPVRIQRGANHFFRILNRWYCHFWQRLAPKVYVLPDGPLILVGNHRAGVDPLLIQAAVNRPLCFLMDREYYQAMWYVRWLLDASGVIPVKPGGANRYALSDAIEAVRQENALCLFPEGAANPDVPLGRILPGAIILALKTGAPILPFRITGTWPFDHVHLWRSFLRRGRASVRFGEPILLPEGPSDKDVVRTWTRAMKQALLDIK